MFRALCVMIIFLFLSAAPVQAGQTLSGPYKATVTEVIDGDTVRARIRVWLGQDIETLIRIDGIDTPEIKSRCPREHTMALQAKETLRSLIGDGEITVHDVKNGKYAGRVIARLYDPSGTDIAGQLIEQNLARYYAGKQRQNWC